MAAKEKKVTGWIPPKTNNYKVVTNHKCEFFPCHKIEPGIQFNCLFCYCPLYFIECPGDYTLLDNGLKDCSQCTIIHRGEEGWEVVIATLNEHYEKLEKEA